MISQISLREEWGKFCFSFTQLMFAQMAMMSCSGEELPVRGKWSRVERQLFYNLRILNWNSTSRNTSKRS